MIAMMLILCTLLSVAVAGAPGDADPLCASISGDAPLPSNAEILMDSYNYLSLLGEESVNVWQQVDLDDNNVAGRATSWAQNSNTPCQQTVGVCGFAQGPQMNWLITQYISRRVNGVLLPQVSVQVLYELRGCDNLQCQRTFAINKYDTSTEDNVLARNVSNYQQVSRVAPDDATGQTRENQTREANFATDSDEEGFYIAIEDETTCIVLYRLIVFYNVCPGGPGELVMRPETRTPLIERVSQPFEVTAQCVAGASPENGNEARLNCIQGGVWNSIPGSGCSCNPGFNVSSDRRSCIAACENGSYYSISREECVGCPVNSEGMEPGLSVCPCVEGYYRAQREDDLACTQSPSIPINVMISSQTSNSVTLTWNEPLDLGGRLDLSYELCYQVVTSGEEECTTSVTTTTGTITGLSPGTQYTVTVRAINGVSSMVPDMELLNSTSVMINIHVPGAPPGDADPLLVALVSVCVLMIVALSIPPVLIIYIFYIKRKLAKLGKTLDDIQNTTIHQQSAAFELDANVAYSQFNPSRGDVGTGTSPHSSDAMTGGGDYEDVDAV